MPDPSSEECLEATLADERLSRGERQALLAVLCDRGSTAQKLAEFRAIAFGRVETRVPDPGTRRLLAWLQEVMKVMVRA